VIKNKKPNPLEFFNLRKSEYLPPHFEVLSQPMIYNIQDSMSNWIDEHLKGRYYVGKSIDIDSDNKIVSVIKIGFEDPKEASYFMLACPHLKYK